METVKKTNTLRSNEALSSGLIFNINAKKEERETIQQQVDDYLAKGNKIHVLKPNERAY